MRVPAAGVKDTKTFTVPMRRAWKLRFTFKQQDKMESHGRLTVFISARCDNGKSAQRGFRLTSPARDSPRAMPRVSDSG